MNVPNTHQEYKPQESQLTLPRPLAYAAAMTDAPRRISDKRIPLNLDGYLTPFLEGAPALIGMTGTPDLFVTVFSSEAKLREACSLFGLPFDDIKQIVDGHDFMAGMRQYVRIAVDLYQHPNGRIRFTEAFLREGSLDLHAKN